MNSFERGLVVGYEDNYTLTLDSDYLAGDTIASASATADSTLLSIDLVESSSSVISATCTGIALGSATIEYSWTLDSGRSRCKKCTIFIEEC